MIKTPIENLKTIGPGKIIAYRNIATCDPSQDLYDDLLDDKEEWEVLQYVDNESSGINHMEEQKNRFFQYGNIDNSLLCFNEKFWRWGRFGDGRFGVWYGALEEETCIKETLHHRPEMDKNDLRKAHNPIIQARRMFKATLLPNIQADLRQYINSHPLLTHKNDYSFCQKLGIYAKKEQIDLYLTKSVRNANGTCIPAFNPDIITDKAIRSYLNIYPLDGSDPKTAYIEDSTYQNLH